MALSKATVDPCVRLQLQNSAYEIDLETYNRNPLDRYVNFKLAAFTWYLAQASVPGKAAETVAMYEHLDLLAPKSQLVDSSPAQIYAATGLRPGRQP